MSEAKKPLYAVTIVKISENLCQSYALTIDGGKVSDVRALTRAEDLPNVAIGLAQRELWAQYRTNIEVPFVKAKS